MPHRFALWALALSVSGCSAIVNPDTSVLDARDDEPDAGPRDPDDAGDGPDDCEEDCDDGASCTVDRCEAGACVHEPDDDLCGVPGDPCSGRIVCDPANGSAESSGCVYDAPPLDCDDGDACTADSCALGACGHAPLDDCGGGCSDEREVCPEGWAYTNDGARHRCALTFTPPPGADDYCAYAATMDLLGFSWPLIGAPTYACPAGARRAPNAMTGYCLFEDLGLPDGTATECASVGSGMLAFTWACE